MIPLVSVIIPAYNAEASLGPCLDSVLPNSLVDFEVIVVDDGSCDATAELATRYAHADRRLRVLHQKNAGVSAARNRGIAEAKGHYLAFVDADDTIAPSYMERLASVMDEQSLDWLACNYYDQDDQLGTHKIAAAPAFTSEVFAHGQEAQRLARQSVFAGPTGKNNLASACFGMYRRSRIQEHQIHFYEDLSIGEDMHFNYQVAHVLSGFGYITDCLYGYSKQCGSAMDKLDLASFLGAHEKLAVELDELHRARGGSGFEPAGRYFFSVRTMYVLRTYALNLKTASKRKASYQRINEFLDHPAVHGYIEQTSKEELQGPPFSALKFYLLRHRHFEAYYHLWNSPLWALAKRIIYGKERT